MLAPLRRESRHPRTKNHARVLRRQDDLACLSTLIRRTSPIPQNNFPAPDGEGIITGKNKLHGAPVCTDPFRREAARFAGAHIPRIGGKDRRPRTPRFRCIVNRESARKTRIFTEPRLAPQITFQPRIEDDMPTVMKNRPSNTSRKGLMSSSTWCLYSVSEISMFRRTRRRTRYCFLLRCRHRTRAMETKLSG